MARVIDYSPQTGAFQPEPMILEAVEITTFRLRGCTVAQFIDANAGVDAWLRRQPGFRSRRIAEQADGSVVDMLVWAAVADGRAAADGLMDELADSPVHDLIDQRTVCWSVSPVRHSIG
ncbi:hypothetical protein [Caulobacter sp. NIBR2454]|uniref:hypothetical protein n=1 Tax=Caulobacter sp. NIBR2454 TaxID=3015996 RepID=UPI0022B6F83A|nr:hypothetical protein [Caulobacter sp. NIBR2454]